MEGIMYLDNFINNDNLFEELIETSIWDDSMASRRTASFGIPYNYSGIEYPVIEMTDSLKTIIKDVSSLLGWEPNNCLINHYKDGNSRMGWHFDRTDILEEGTGVVIISLGSIRTLRFREIENKDNKIDYNLLPNSLFYMTSEIQDIWHHSIPSGEGERISLTLRKIKV